MHHGSDDVLSVQPSLRLKSLQRLHLMGEWAWMQRESHAQMVHQVFASHLVS